MFILINAITMALKILAIDKIGSCSCMKRGLRESLKLNQASITNPNLIRNYPLTSFLVG